MWHLFLGNFLSWIASFQNIQGAFLESQLVKNLQCRRPQLNSWVRKFPWRRVGITTPVTLCFPGASDSKGSAWNAGDLGSDPGLGRSPGRRHDNPLQYYCLEDHHGQRSLVAYSPGGHKELDTTETTKPSTAQNIQGHSCWWWTITDSMDMSLGKLQELVMDSLACCGSWGHRVRHDWVTELNWTETYPWGSLILTGVTWCSTAAGFPGGSAVKNLPAMQQTQETLHARCWEDLLEKAMAIHSSILAWEIPWAEESGGLQPVGLHRHD